MSGGGGNQTTTVDPIYNQGLLEIAKEDQEFKKTFMNMFQYGVAYDPNEKVEGKYIDGKWVDKDKLTPEQIGPEQWTTNTDPNAYEWGEPVYDEYGNVASQGKKIKSGYEEKILNPNYQGLETKTRGELQGYDPSSQTSEMKYLQNLVESNQKLLGLQEDVSKKELSLAGATAEASQGLIPYQTEASKQQALLSGEQAGAARKLLPGLTALKESTLADINKGIDVNKRMDEAQAGVQHGFKLANEASRRDIASYGLDPSSGRYASQNRGTALAEATGISGARTQAKNTAEEEAFKRKITGIQVIQ